MENILKVKKQAITFIRLA